MRLLRSVLEWSVMVAILGVAAALGAWFGTSEIGGDFYDRFWWQIVALLLLDLVISAVIFIRRKMKWVETWWWFWKDEISMATLSGLCSYVVWTSRGKLLVDAWQEWVRSEWLIVTALPVLVGYGAAVAIPLWIASRTERRRMRLIEAAQRPLPSCEPNRSLLVKGGLIE